MLTGIHDRLLSAVADELSSLARRIENLGASAASDSGFAARNMTLLQEVDLIAQTQNELAAVLRVLADHGPDRALSGVRLEALAERLAL